MITLRVKECTSDRGYFDVSDETYDVEVEEGSSIIDVVVGHFKYEHGYLDNDVKELLELIESGRWYGGEWSKEDSNTLMFISDVTQTEYSI